MSSSSPQRASASRQQVRVLLVGGSTLVRGHVHDILSAFHHLTSLDDVHAAHAWLHDRPADEAPPVIIVFSRLVQDGLDAVSAVRQHPEDARAPVLLVVEAADPLPRDLDALPDEVIRGRVDRVDLLLRVRALSALAQARHAANDARRDAVDTRLASDKYRRALERERETVKTLARYISPAVLEQVQTGEAGHAPARQPVSVLFSDIRGFTDASAFSAPEDVVELLGDYLPEVNRIVAAQGGVLDKFMGDGILAYFRATRNQPESARRAVTAASQLLERLEELKVRWFERGFLPVGVGVGVTTGQAILGTIGYGERLDHTVIGPVVNLAARLQGLARGGEVVIDQPTFDGVRGMVHVHEGRRASVKGFDEPVMVYTLARVDSGPDG